jgi:hypothetical protein
MKSSAVRLAFLLATPLVLAVVLWFHPGADGDTLYSSLRNEVTTTLVVHITMLFFIPLMALAAFVLLNGMQSRAATVGRWALGAFVAFYTAWEVSVGLVTGFLTDYANGLDAQGQAVIADAIEHHNGNFVIGDASITLIIGGTGWIVAMLAAAIAVRSAGGSRLVAALIACASLFALHPPPIGPIGLICFAVGVALFERTRARATAAPMAASPLLVS